MTAARIVTSPEGTGSGPGGPAAGMSSPVRPGRLWRARFDPRRLPGWAQALVVFAASRVLFTFVAFRTVDFAGWRRDGTHWTYLQIANNWDGTWYQRIAVQGYPAQLPHDGTGAVAPNTWAFFPLYPWIAGAVQTAGLSWAAAATAVSLVCAAAAIVLVRSVTAHVAGPRIAFWTTAFLSFFPSALVLQLPYSEALALLLLAAVLRCLQRGQYLLAAPLLLLLGLARPVAAPLAIVVTVHLAAEVRAVRAVPRVLAARALAAPLLTWLAAVVAVLEWPLVIWWRTGVRDGYRETMAAWRTPHLVVLFRPWVNASQLFLGRCAGPVVLVTGVAALAWWLWRQGRRVAGRDLTVWCAAYAAYLLAVLDSFTSLPRYLLPLFPLGTMLAAASGSRAFRVTVTAASGVLGVIWMLVIWRSRAWAP
jgi:hypothetical protein